MKLTIGNVKLDTPFLLAPLAGITDSPMRKLNYDMGASLTFTEMVSAKGFWYGDRNTKKLLHLDKDEGKVGLQIFGNDPEIMAYMAQKIEEQEEETDPPNRFKILDINMGCPVPKVVKNFEGSYLMKDPFLIEKIVAKVVSATKKPVTCKIRLGFDEDNINATECAKAIEAGGAKMVTVHGRTREQFYSGNARYDEIAKVKRAVGIPVCGNGDVFSWQGAKKMLEETECDFVMIARGALGNPWIFKELNAWWKGEEIPEAPSKEEKKRVLIEHLNKTADLKGEDVAVRESRKHVGWYVKGMPNAAAFRGKVNNITDIRELISEINNI